VRAEPVGHSGPGGGQPGQLDARSAHLNAGGRCRVGQLRRVADSLVNFPSPTVGVSVSRSDTDRDSRQASDTAQRLATSARQMSDTMPSAVSDTPSHSLNGSGTAQALTGHSRPTTDTAAITPASFGTRSDKVSDSSDTLADTSDTYPVPCAGVCVITDTHGAYTLRPLPL
jgi:hypothetical protein